VPLKTAQGQVVSIKLKVTAKYTPDTATTFAVTFLLANGVAQIVTTKVTNITVTGRGGGDRHYSEGKDRQN
jgi:hypothetical protein